MGTWDQFYFVSLPVAFLLTLLLVPPIKIIAQKWQFVSKIDFRRRELVPRPLLGGVAIFTSCFVACLIAGNLPLKIMLPGLMLVLIGMYDDRFQMNPKLKLLGEFAAVGLWLYMTPATSLLLVKMGLPLPVAYGLHAFWVIGMINAFNMIDGMDGLASGVAVLAFLFFGLFLPYDLQWFAWSFAAASVGHLFYNRPPATIFLGDSGSLLLGFVLAALGSTLETDNLNPSTILVPLFILAHPEVDALLAMARRWKAGTPLFQGDKDHIHHKLRRIGLGPYGSLAVTYFATIYCGLTAVLMDSIHGPGNLILALCLCILGVCCLLGGIYFTEHRLGAQFSQLGTPLLHRYVKLTKDPTRPTGPYRAVIFDLLPYYKEIQERGVDDLNAFIQEFSYWVNNTFKTAQIVPFGAYSVIVIETAEFNRDQVLVSFKAIVTNHHLLKNNVGVPWGLHFFNASTDSQAFEKKFGLFQQPRVVENNQAA